MAAEKEQERQPHKLKLWSSTGLIVIGAKSQFYKPKFFVYIKIISTQKKIAKNNVIKMHFLYIQKHLVATEKKCTWFCTEVDVLIAKLQ